MLIIYTFCLARIAWSVMLSLGLSQTAPTNIIVYCWISLTSVNHLPIRLVLTAPFPPSLHVILIPLPIAAAVANDYTHLSEI
jgi:hypothetical protein